MGIASSWREGRSYKEMGSCSTAVRYAEAADEEIRSDVARPLALKEKSVEKSGRTDVMVSFEAPYLLAVGGERRFIRHVFGLFLVELCVMWGLARLRLEAISFTVEALSVAAVLLRM